MHYKNIVPAIFLERPNRFVAHCLVEGQPVVAHVKNTGRCREILLPGTPVWLQRQAGALRKTGWDLITAQKGGPEGLLINIDSQVTQRATEEALTAGTLRVAGEPVRFFRREAVWGDSRYDLYVETDHHSGYMEIKGCTLEREGLVLFPDAPTLRGAKHVRGLTELAANGMYAGLFFCVQLGGMAAFTPNRTMDPAFADAVEQAALAGVEIRAFCCRVTPDSIDLAEEIPVFL